MRCGVDPRIDVKAPFPFVGCTPAEQRVEDVQAFVDGAAEDPASSSRARRLAAVKSLLSFANRIGFPSTSALRWTSQSLRTGLQNGSPRKPKSQTWSAQYQACVTRRGCTCSTEPVHASPRRHASVGGGYDRTRMPASSRCTGRDRRRGPSSRVANAGRPSMRYDGEHRMTSQSPRPRRAVRCPAAGCTAS